MNLQTGMEVPNPGDLDLQLSELEMLRSMFPGEGELVMDSPAAEEDVRTWLRLNERGEATEVYYYYSYYFIIIFFIFKYIYISVFFLLQWLPPLLSFCLTLRQEEASSSSSSFPSPPVEFRATLGRAYPSAAVGQLEVHAKSDAFSRDSQAQLNAALRTQLEESSGEGQLVLGVLLQWLQEHWTDYRVSAAREEGGVAKRTVGKKERTFSRLWIYSHHIYSKTKRKDILDLSSEFQLTGFSMPGKPGVVCLEGCSRNCAEAWAAIKSWNWKKINVKVQEDEEVADDVDRCRRFEGFQEIGFVKSGESRDYHMDMGEFFNFLKNHRSDYMFKELFGISKAS